MPSPVPVSISTGPASACALEDILRTDALFSRPAREPEHAAENRALLDIARAFEESPDTVLQTLVTIAMRLCRAESAGISMEEIDGTEPIFRWRATAGVLGPALGGTMPRFFSPCGVTVDRRAPQLMTEPIRYYPYIAKLNLPIREVLLTPFYRHGVPVGTLWIVNHTQPERAFDAEDARIVGNLARFVSAATAFLDDRQALQGLGLRLAELGSQMEVAYQAGAIATWTWDPVADRVFADDNVAKLFSVSPADANGGKLAVYLKALHPDDHARVAAAIQRALETGGGYEAEYRILRPDGSVRWVNARSRIFRNREGVATRLPGVIVDITSQREIEARLAEQNRTLEARVAERTAALDAKINEMEAFSYSISHDLRAPLRAMQTYAKLLLDEFMGPDEAEPREYARRIAKASERMDRLVRDVLVISRVAREETPLERIPLEAFVASLVETYPNFRPEVVAVVTHAPLHEVLANPAVLTQCLSNLLSNAVKFVAPGTKPQVRIWSEVEQRRVKVFVQDNGIGIPDREQQNIFGMFYQVKPDAMGTGIGLAVARKAAERMGGALTVDSREGCGSTFCLELHAADVA